MCRCFQSKDAYNFDIPICESTSAHLSQKVINACISIGKEQRPINPHAQRLLTAQARQVSKLPTAKAAKKTAAKAKAQAVPGDDKDPLRRTVRRRMVTRLTSSFRKSQVFRERNIPKPKISSWQTRSFLVPLDS